MKLFYQDLLTLYIYIYIYKHFLNIFEKGIYLNDYYCDYIVLIWARGDFHNFVKNNLKFKKTFATLFKTLGKNSKR
ncbi:hypothetical protein ACMBCM_02410 [Spiroplasma sp. K1]